MVPKVFIISHTHWDREWFVPSGFTSEWLVPFLDELSDRFRTDPEYRFALDGQSLLIEDALAHLDAEEGERLLAELSGIVAGGRLAVGPYYQQPDWQLVSGEALIRNLQIGSADAASLGGVSRAGWLPDNFGQIGQCVQIHSGFGIEGLFGWRGFDLPPERLSTEFWWSSPDGSRLPLVYLADSYRNGMRLFSHPRMLQRRLEEAVSRLSPFAPDGSILLLNGYDQEMEPEELVRDGLPFPLHSTLPEAYVGSRRSAMERKGKSGGIPELGGAQYSGRFISVFPGILSARNYLKVFNDRAQAMQERYLEPMSVLAWLSVPGRWLESIRDELEVLWRLILQNHPHDTICGVSSDPVHEVSEVRSDEIHRRQHRLLARLVEALNPVGTESEPVVFNPSPFERRAAIDGRLTAPVAPLTIGRVAFDATGSLPPVGVKRSDDGAFALDNGLVSVTVSPTGAVEVHDRAHPENLWRLMWRDVGDRGDTYNFDPVEGDTGEDRLPEGGEVRVLVQKVNLASLRLEARIHTPAELDASRERRSDETTTNALQLDVEVRSDEPFARFVAVVDNRARDHRLQLHFHRKSDTDGGTVPLWSLMPFEWHDADRYRDELGEWGTVPPEVERLMLGARETQPPRYVPSDRAFCSGDERGALAVAHRGLHELEATRSGVAATVVRSVGYLARGDLTSRTGDAGPEILTPGAQCRRTISVEFGVMPTGSPRAAKGVDVQRFVEEILVPVMTVTAAGAAGSPARVETRGVPLPVTDAPMSACRIGEDGKGVVLRFWNPTGRDLPVAVPGGGAPAIERITLDERPAPEVSTDRIAPYAIATYRLPAEEGVPGLRDRRDVGAVERFKAAFERAFPEIGIGRSVVQLRYDAWGWLLPLGESAPAVSDASLLEGASLNVQALTRDHQLERERRAALVAGREREAGRRTDGTERDSIHKQAALSTLERRILEAELSVLFVERELGLTEHEKLPASIREIALKLNHARVAKRTDDYLVALVDRPERA